MRTEDVIREFGSVRALAGALEITVQAVYQWGATVPPLREFQIRELRKGKPKAREFQVSHA